MVSTVTRPSILVVDDHPTQQLMMRQLAEFMRVEITVVSTGRQALDTLAGQSFDLVLMDWQ
ncbi:MAG: response regulator, partial [Terriglobales bacterium]